MTSNLYVVLKVGDVLYRWDGKEDPIVGETRQKWLLRSGLEVKKAEMRKGVNSAESPHVWVSQEAAIDYVYLLTNRRHVVMLLETLKDAKLFRSIAQQLGYQETK